MHRGPIRKSFCIFQHRLKGKYVTKITTEATRNCRLCSLDMNWIKTFGASKSPRSRFWNVAYHRWVKAIINGLQYSLHNPLVYTYNHQSLHVKCNKPKWGTLRNNPLGPKQFLLQRDSSTYIIFSWDQNKIDRILYKCFFTFTTDEWLSSTGKKNIPG